MLSAFLYGQVVLAGASVLCVTRDGKTHLETADNHGHCMGKPNAGCGSHIHEDSAVAAACLDESHCHDIPLSQTFMAVMSVKRFTKMMDCDCQLQTNALFHTEHFNLSLLVERSPPQDRLSSLRTVVLLI